MAKKLDEKKLDNLIEKVVGEYSINQPSEVKQETKKRLSESLNDTSDNYFLLLADDMGLDYAVHELKNCKSLSPAIADLLLWISSSDELILRLKQVSNFDVISRKKETMNCLKRADYESLELLIKYMLEETGKITNSKEWKLLLLRSQVVEKYISAVAANMDSFTKISAKWLKVLADAWYSDKVSEYVKSNKKYVKKS